MHLEKYRIFQRNRNFDPCYKASDILVEFAGVILTRSDQVNNCDFYTSTNLDSYSKLGIILTEGKFKNKKKDK